MSATYNFFFIYKLGTHTEDNVAVTHTQYLCSKISMIIMQKILNEILNDIVRNYDNPQYEPELKKLNKTQIE